MEKLKELKLICAAFMMDVFPDRSKDIIKSMKIISNEIKDRLTLEGIENNPEETIKAIASAYAELTIYQMNNHDT